MIFQFIIMNLVNFKSSLSGTQPPQDVSVLMQSLWHDAKGDWEAAHDIAQKQEGVQSYDRLHAYLHRKEGDNWQFLEEFG